MYGSGQRNSPWLSKILYFGSLIWQTTILIFHIVNIPRHPFYKNASPLKLTKIYNTPTSSRKKLWKSNSPCIEWVQKCISHPLWYQPSPEIPPKRPGSSPYPKYPLRVPGTTLMYIWPSNEKIKWKFIERWVTLDSMLKTTSAHGNKKALSPFYHKKYFYDKMGLRFYFRVT